MSKNSISVTNIFCYQWYSAHILSWLNIGSQNHEKWLIGLHVEFGVRSLSLGTQYSMNQLKLIELPI